MGNLRATSRFFDKPSAASTATLPRRSARTNLARFSYRAESDSDEDKKSSQLTSLSDIEDAAKPLQRDSSSPARRTGTVTRKRKRAATATKLEASSSPPPAKIKAEAKSESESESESTTTSAIKSKPKRAPRKPARKITSPTTGAVKVEPPSNWEEMYAVAKKMRLPGGAASHAAVDTMGCERLASADASARDRRFHTLVALMLSSQTKDTVNAEAMIRLKKELPGWREGEPAGLNLENMLVVEPGVLNELIGKVGFHNNKTKYLKQAAVILRDRYNSDIPDTIEGLMSLPGVGPKMAHLCMSADNGWGRVEGIGVDVHVHRITNLWGWQHPPSKNPEETRLALQSWLPRDKWKEINWLLVGLGQAVCLPVGRKCGDCQLGLRGLCKAADRKKVSDGRRKREMEVKAEIGIEVGVDEDEDERKVVVKKEKKVARTVKEEPVTGRDVEARIASDQEGAFDETMKQELVKKEEVLQEDTEIKIVKGEPEDAAGTVKREVTEDATHQTIKASIEEDTVKDEAASVKRETTIKEEVEATVAKSGRLQEQVLDRTVKQEIVKEEEDREAAVVNKTVKEIVKRERAKREVAKEEAAEERSTRAVAVKDEVVKEEEDTVIKEGAVDATSPEVKLEAVRVAATRRERPVRAGRGPTRR